jgi:hypothetical protein
MTMQIPLNYWGFVQSTHLYLSHCNYPHAPAVAKTTDTRTTSALGTTSALSDPNPPGVYRTCESASNASSTSNGKGNVE